jgi:SNF2 family DNA or RNA helicase
MIDAIRRVRQAADEDDKWKLKEALRKMFGCVVCMQQSLFHPVLPNGGREITVLFSPSRRDNQKIKNSLENEFKCVYCYRWIKPKKKAKNVASVAALDLDELEDEFEKYMNEDVDDFSLGESFDSNSEDEPRPDNKTKGKGKIVAIDPDICHLAKRGIRHFACESCLDRMKFMRESCPKCIDLLARAKLDSKNTNDPINIGCNRIYCQDVFGGFRASAKLEKIVRDFISKVPKDKKAMITSFYKGPLDLLEAMFDEHGIEAVRFDGDVVAEQRHSCLEKFKNTPSCRVLLMTAQTGGTGLNITEANYGLFTE